MNLFKGWRIQSVVVVVMLAIVLPLSILVSLIDFHHRKVDELMEIDTRLFNAATFAGAILPPNYHNDIEDAASIGPEVYQGIVALNNSLCEQLGLEYLWSLMMLDGQLVFTSATSPGKAIESQDHAKFLEVHSNPELYEEAFRTMEPQYQDSIDKWGNIRAVLIPHYDARGRKFLMGASMKHSDIQALMPPILRDALGTAIVFLIPGILISILISRGISRPISQLAASAETIGNGEYFNRIDVAGPHEINVVANQLETMRKAILESVSSLHAKVADMSEFKETLNASPILTFKVRFDENLTTEFISDNYAMLGYDVRDLWSGTVPWKSIMPEEDVERADQATAKALASDSDHYHLETRLIWASGEVHWYMAWNEIVRDERGNPEFIRGLLMDITELKTAQERDELHQQQLETTLAELRGFEHIVNSSPIIVYRLRFEPEAWPVEFISENVGQLGYDPSKLLSGETTWNSINHPEDIPKVNDLLRKVMARGETTFNLESRILTKEGAIRQMESWNQLITDASGNITHIHGLFKDVTTLKDAQRKEALHLERLNETLRELQAFEKIVTSSPVFTFKRRIAEDFPTEHISQNICITGYTAEDFLTNNVQWTDLIPPEDYSLLERKALQCAEAGIDHYEVGFRMVWKNGESHWYTSWNSVLRDESGIPTHVQGLVSDISDLKNAHERDVEYQTRLKALAQDLVQVEDNERRQLAIVLHDDIGQMLAALNMKLTALKETSERTRIDDLAQQVDVLLLRIMKTCKSLTWEISPTSLYETNIDAGIERLAADLKTFFGLEVECHTAGMRIEADRATSALIFRCAKELLVNIAKHAGTNKAQIGVSQYGNKFHMVVSDQGSGLCPEDLEHGSGKGFGLFSIRERLEHINGSMHVESDPGKGTKIMMVIPVDIGDEHKKSPPEKVPAG
ncbi:Oxygen sensor histidine kinase NreB [Pontiella desulfatans]|uniref:Oxygen sensor histidine kinase NreB n=1 Tax=Pontiella desulfatans TaxID=2750659 RepID=A0A6C2TZ43_PONDE|nr:PAS domain-containing protein [Pontiella desulfatans]VGO12734.1 Oxygen sensor histidine kinase NreB [Pontiella desulfatans]